MGITPDQKGKRPGTPTEQQCGQQTDISGTPIHRETHSLEGVAVEVGVRAHNHSLETNGAISGQSISSQCRILATINVCRPPAVPVAPNTMIR